MPRAAGNSSHYTFRLFNESTGRYEKDVEIRLPSSTTIVKSTLAAQQLIGWAYRTTRDNIAGAVSVLRRDLLAGVSTPEDYASGLEVMVDVLEDGDWLEEFLKENRLRPDDVRDERAEEGKREHDTLERLAKIGLEDPEAAVIEAHKVATKAQGSEFAICDWWIARHPHPVAAERVLPCPQHGYCGTTDLVYLDLMAETKVVCDLKTRRAGLFDYDSDQFQVDSYLTAYNLLHPEAPADYGTVLLAFDDGSWAEERVILEPGSFLKLKEVWDCVQRARSIDRNFGR